MSILSIIGLIVSALAIFALFVLAYVVVTALIVARVFTTEHDEDHEHIHGSPL